MSRPVSLGDGNVLAIKHGNGCTTQPSDQTSLTSTLQMGAFYAVQICLDKAV